MLEYLWEMIKVKNYYIDLGSSTIKVYCYENELELLEEHSIYFKNDFDAEKGISESNLKELCDYFEEIKNKYDLKYCNTNIYATGIFRNLIRERKQDLVKLFNDKFDIHFNIISHGIENYYLAKAMQNDYNGNKVLIINMGGKTTELVTFIGKDITNTQNINVGVADLLNNFDRVNEKFSGNTLEEMEKFIADKLTDVVLDKDYDCAIFTGGEERFELLAGFNLIENTLFNDNIHKYMLTLDDYVAGTKKVLYNMSLDELHSLMPSNPKWMDGARSGAIIPLVLFKKANVKWIIPSDLNLINGVINDLN
jgi:exopolyphosphatase/pppGpp-phosphohydrolase